MLSELPFAFAAWGAPYAAVQEHAPQAFAEPACCSFHFAVDAAATVAVFDKEFRQQALDCIVAAALKDNFVAVAQQAPYLVLAC